MDTRPSLGIGIDVPAGQVILRVIVATTQDQQGLDEKYGVDVVRLQGELVPARQREPLIATSPVWPTHLDRTQPEPESYRRVRTQRSDNGSAYMPTTEPGLRCRTIIRRLFISTTITDAPPPLHGPPGGTEAASQQPAGSIRLGRSGRLAIGA